MPQQSIAPWWTSKPDPETGRVIVHDYESRRIAEILPTDDKAVTDANVRLIRLAPTILMALKLAAECLRRDKNHDKLYSHLIKTVEAIEDPHKQPNYLQRVA